MKKRTTTQTSERRNGTSTAKERAAKKWQLRLYIAGMSATAAAALQNLEYICEQHLGGVYSIEIIDLLKKPQLASGDQIIAVPTLVRRLPTPVKKIIGDLSNTERVLVGLDIRPMRRVRRNDAQDLRGQVRKTW